LDVAEVSIGAGASVKIRNPVHVLLSDLVTLGVYGVVWYVKVNRELAMLGRIRHTTELGENPRNSLLAVVPGFVIIVPAVVSILNTAKRLRAAQGLVGIPEADHVNIPLAFALMFFLPPVGSWYFQKRLNNVWHACDTASVQDA
jgi:hypothetical protein